MVIYMGSHKAIFTNKKRFHWFSDESGLIGSLSIRDLNQKWFIAELFVPDYPDYNVEIHKKEISSLLESPDDLVEFAIPDEIKQRVRDLDAEIRSGR